MFTLWQNWYLPQLHEVKKKVCCSFFSHYISLSPPSSHPPTISLSHTCFLCLHTLFLFHDPRVLFQQQSITYSTSSSLIRLQSERCSISRPSLYLSPALSPLLPYPRLTPHFLVSLHLRSAFPYHRFPPWLADKYHFEGLHKPLPSHFLTEMAFLPICTVSDHTEHSLHRALIPISSTDTVKGGDWESHL